MMVSPSVPADVNSKDCKGQNSDLWETIFQLSTIIETLPKFNLRNQLSLCVLANESSRKSEKNSKSYPRKKRKRQTGEPNIVSWFSGKWNFLLPELATGEGFGR